MTKQNRNILLLVVGVLLLFSFKKAKKRKSGPLIISNPKSDQYKAKKGAQIYDEFDPSIILYNNFRGGEWINILEDSGIDYHVIYTSPEKGLIEGFMNYNDITK